MREKAWKFLNILRASTDATVLADDLLVFFYDLRDNYSVAHSSSPRFSAKSFSILGELLYSLESRPDETMQNEHWRSFCEMVLEDIALGRIEIAKK